MGLKVALTMYMNWANQDLLVALTCIILTNDVTHRPRDQQKHSRCWSSRATPKALYIIKDRFKGKANVFFHWLKLNK